MSFSEDQKREITSSQYKSLCCRRALLSGALRAKGEVRDGWVEMRVSEEFARSFLSELILEIYSKDPEIVTPSCGGRGKIIRFKSNSAVKYIEGNAKNGQLPYAPKCNYCRSAFLRGVFLASGRTSEPEKQYALEFSFSDGGTSVFDFLLSLGLDFKSTVRAGKKIVYTKNSTVIEDFFGTAGMNVTAFSVMNNKIKSELRNNANRVANCETNNIDKAVNTAMRQIAVISALEDAGLLGALPDELAHTARLRLEYNSLSLSQLAGKFTPSISKPGLSHRLAKIEELGKKLLDSNK